MAASNSKSSGKDPKSKGNRRKRGDGEGSSPTKGSDDDRSITSVHSDDSQPSSSTPTSNKKGTAADRQAKHLKQQFGSDKELKLTNICPTIKTVADGSRLDLIALANDLLEYAKTYHKWNSNSLELHSFDAIFQALWRHICSNTVRNMLRNTVIDLYYNLDDMTRIVFRPVMEKVRDFSPTFSTSDRLNRRRMVALDSKEIPMSGTKLDSKTTPVELAQFKEAMERASEARTDWKRLLMVRIPVNGSTGSKTSTKQQFEIKNILTEFKSITIKQLGKIDFHTSESLQDASLALYEALQNSMSSSFSGQMRLYNDKIKHQGPKLLYFILHKLTQRDSRIVADLQLELPKLESTFKDTGFDMHLVCPALFDRLQQYQCAGGTPDTHYSVICSALLSMHCDSLTSAVREWEQAQMRKYNKKNIFDLLQKLPMIVDNLIADGTWPHQSSTVDRTLASQFQRSKSSSKNSSSSINTSDLTAFKGEVEQMIKSSSSKTASKALKAMIAHNKKSSTSPPNHNADPPKPRKPNHAFESSKWGPNKLYKTKEQFQEFWNCAIPGMEKSKSYDYEGVTWYWCEKCQRMGNHPTEKHRDKKRKRGSGGNNPPSASSNSNSPPSAFNATADLGSSSMDNDDASTFDADKVNELLDEIDSDASEE